jgi:hypothetical protein
VGGVRCGEQLADKLGDVREPSGSLQLALDAEAFANQLRINRLTSILLGDDSTPDRLVTWAIEVLGLDDLGYCVDLGRSHENSPEKLPLGSEIRWWLSIT